MKKFFVFMAATCCALAINATTYTSHVKVTVNTNATEQDEVQVVLNEQNGLYNLSLKNFCLTAEGMSLPVGNIELNGVQGVDEYGYTTIVFNGPITITPGDDPAYSQDEWLGPILGEVPIDATARFTDTALSANIDINLAAMGQIIQVNLFGVAPASVTPALDGDVNHDGEVNVSDVNKVIDIILKH